MSKIKLNEGQQKAVNLLVDGFLNGTTKGVTLIGEGGTGKTTCIMFAAEQWMKAGMNVLFTAPTNKAVKQLEHSARQYGLDFSRTRFCTVAKALGLALLPSEENKYASQQGASILCDYDVLVMDEGSMVGNTAFFRYLLPDIEDNNLRTVIMGDKMQLPPVKETNSPALEHFPVVELTTVERFGEGTGIASLTTTLRDSIENDKAFLFDGALYDVEVVKPAQFLSRILEEFDGDTDHEKVRVLAYTNARVDRINAAVREKIYGRDAKLFEVGERVVTGAPIVQDRELLLATDEECYVRNMIESSILDDDSGETYRTLMVTLEPVYATDVGTVYAHVIHPDEAARLQDSLQAIANKARAKTTTRNQSTALWAKWHRLKDLFSNLRYCYCITVHRSQGSTYETVLVDVDNILTNRRKDERRKLLYVAFSRASKRLVANKEKYSS